MRSLFLVDPAMCACTGGYYAPSDDCDRCGGMGRICCSCESAMGDSPDAYCNPCRSLIGAEEGLVVQAEAELAFAAEHPPTERQVGRALVAIDRGDLRGLCDALRLQVLA